MSRLSSFFRGHPEVLPKHLQEKKHNDWPLLFNKLPRSFNVRGPRAGKGNPGYLPWPPKLIEGRGVARWEQTGASSIIYIPALADRRVTAEDVYLKSWIAVEMNPSDPLYGQRFEVMLTWDESAGEPDKFAPQQYSPSALQIFSNNGWMKLSPNYQARWGKLGIAQTGEPLFSPNWRWGWRPDHLDVYYNWGPYAGLSFE